MSTYDVVVIGAGNGGLTAASSLAQKGVKVLLLEKHNVPGGCATSFCRGRFEFETALHQLSGFGTKEKPGPLRGFLSSLGVVDGLEWVEMENLYRVILPEKLDITLPADKEKFINVLETEFPEEKAGIEKYVNLLYGFFEQVIQAFFMKDPDISREKYPLYFEYAYKNTKDVLDECFANPLLKLALSPYWSYMGIPTRNLAFVDYAALMYSYIEWKPFHLKGGSQALSNALVNTILENGGEIRFNCKAEEIVVEHGQVKGVRTSDDDFIPVNYVISNASSVMTYTELIDTQEVPEQQYEILKGSTVGVSALTMFIGLDCTAEKLGIYETTNFFYASVEPDEQDSTIRFVSTEKDPFLLTCYNVSDPDASPAGTTQIAIVCLKYAEPWLRIPPADYQATKFKCAEQILARIENEYPGFREHIEEIEVATPVTHMRYLGSPGGAFYGFDQYAKDSNMFIPPKPVIKGLFAAGAWAGSGGFQPTLMSGGTAARALMRDMKKQGVN
ncbi:Uncharacterized [Syntrophomonas zehnderi OL-4]|uniref:Uncharacterized n=1 Tax=Syntrophomonas zehnderi OL-4 TaxID=690567 RepID=A0A0E4C7U5_9FIRM|nr:NAD(P)/FAD-dependent oxidoreductase [Syntrophomonas zehnderi]CFX14247.1 Uncharacterized [Syntrophomonas zehnderi OL-4]